jgi:hypothetical protein
MNRLLLTAVAATASLAASATRSAGIQNAAAIAGVWTLNKSLSEMPPEIGFPVDWLPPPDTQHTGSGAGSRGESRGRGRSPAPPGATPPVRRESFEDARRVQLLTEEARNPPARLMIVDSGNAVTITNELGQSRTYHPNGKEEAVDLEGISARATTARDGEQLTILYHIDEGRTVRFTYSPSSTPQQLAVEVQFLEHGKGDKAKRVYEPGVPTQTVPEGRGTPASVPAVPRAQTQEKFDSRPGAELKGLKTLGILVEDLSTQAVGCGLNRDELETALARRLTDGGFIVHKNSDEDTYVYVNVMTSTVTGGLCVSRYDAFLYTHATASLTYRDQPVLVQVSLMHRGGIGSSAPVSHAAAVTRGLENYIDLFVSQIRSANQ